MNSPSSLCRRDFISSITALAAVSSWAADTPAQSAEPIIDIHQHTNYAGRTNKQLLTHQRALGVTTTILLPAGSKFGLDCDCGGNETVVAMARQYPNEFRFFANELPDIPQAQPEIEKYLRLGAIGIGEQKFQVPCDGPAMAKIAQIAQDFDVPVLLHFQHALYNTGMENFHKTLEKFPRVNFIGHAQTWWANVDKNAEQKVLYPKSKITPGGITDLLLRDYPNMFGDLSAGSGLNFLERDEEQAAAFLHRHQDKLLFGTDCNDPFGQGPGCQGAQTLAAIRRLLPNKQTVGKILHGNAKRLLKL